MARAFGTGFAPGFGGPQNVGTLLLKVGTVGPEPAYQDGDIVCAFNRRHTRHCHAEVICHPRRAGFTASGLRPNDSHARRYVERTHQYRFERVSPTTITRTNLLTSAVDVIGPTPNERGEAMDVVLYLQRRLGHPGHRIFGEPGAEVWYGGTQRADHAALNQVWSDIETHSALREVNYADWPLGSEEFTSFLAIRVDDCDDPEAAALASPEWDDTDPDNPILIRKRARHVPWRELRGMSAQRIAQIEDRAVAVDIRAERKHVRAVHVRSRGGG